MYLYRVNMNMDTVVRAIHGQITFVTGFKPCFHAYSGSDRGNLVLRNIQARSRMMTLHLFVQLLSCVCGRDGGLSVLRSANID